MAKKALVLGAGGFIGSHLVKRLKQLGYQVTGADLKLPEFSETAADVFVQGDLRLQDFTNNLLAGGFDEVYQLAADMGGAGYIFTGDNDADVMHNSATINLNVLHAMRMNNCKKVFYSSSACIYPEHNQLDPNNPNCEESSAYPAAPDSEYGWEKLFSERLFASYRRNYGIEAHVARFHNIFGEEGTWRGGKEKAPAAICRKVAEAQDGGSIEIWGDGLQTRSFLHVSECIDGILLLMQSDFYGPVNIGSEEMISINDLAKMAANISGKSLTIKNIPGPTGVRGRNSDNKLIKEKLHWVPSRTLVEGITTTYRWIEDQLKQTV
jgi:GDP-D-mannose 3', 5'-epimerase